MVKPEIPVRDYDEILDTQKIGRLLQHFPLLRFKLYFYASLPFCLALTVSHKIKCGFIPVYGLGAWYELYAKEIYVKI
jgi:hypothetical protein